MQILPEIPPYPAARELTLDDKPFFDELFQCLQPRISELTFAGLYLFRSAHAYRLSRVGESLVVLGRGYGGEEYFLPPLSGDRGAAALLLLEQGLTLYGADDPFVRDFLQGRGLRIVEDRDNSDYLYLRRELAELPGNRYHKKKNRINYFTTRHSYLVEPYAEQHREGALRLLDEWRRVREGIESVSIRPEMEATATALRLSGVLGLQGVVVMVEGRLKAFVLGERLNAETSVCHFEKADPFLEGLYQLADREFNRLLFTDCTYANREQDLGEPNLRKSKLSYHPVELVRKYRISSS